MLTEKWPVLGRHDQAETWLTIWTDLGPAPRTIDAYGRGLAEYLLMCEREDVDPGTANRAHIAVYVRELTSRPHRRGANVISIDSGAGLANATIQQRLVRCACSTTSSWRRGCGSPTPSAAVGTPPAGGAADSSVARCHG